MKILLKFVTRLRINCLIGVMLLSMPLFAQTLSPKAVPKFVNPLPIPTVINASEPGNTDLTITMSQFRQDLGLGLKDSNGDAILTTVWGYNGQYPGPTIFAKKGLPVNVKWLNRMVDENNNQLPHLLPVDVSIKWADPETGGVPLVTHLHGGHVESASDGLPGAWYTPFALSKGPLYVKGENIPYHYENSQEAATIWYHDHTLGITRLNVYAGLAGFYILTDDHEQALVGKKLPARPYDIGLAIQDRLFTTEGELYYPSEPDDESNHSILPEFFGDIILVNGATWPVLDVEPRQYRFRVLNGSDSRFYNLFLPGIDKFWQVASDNGLLPAPIGQNKLTIAPGERKEIIIDFSDPDLWGKTLIMRNNAKSPFPNGETVNPNAEGQIMAFRVSKKLDTTYPLTPVPASLGVQLPVFPPSTETRQLILFEGMDEYGRLKPMLGTVKDGALEFHDPITENPELGATEIWEIYNLTPDSHPIHLHLVSFKVLGSQKFKGEVDMENGSLHDIRLLGKPTPPEPGQEGRKDTYPVAPGEVTRLIATFDKEGFYVWHCHILSHEDHDMMRPYYVGKLPADLMAGSSVHEAAGLGEEIINKGAYSLYPNPFSTSATLQLKLTESVAVAMRLYDLSGRLVREVPARLLPAGQHQLEINGNDMQTGMYVCEVEVNNKMYRSKLVLTR